jgi:MFS transporter, DHA1 family, inner membrane transport protein
VIIGLLNDIASNLKISISEAGTLISGFAVAFAIGTPVLTAILSRFSRFPLILFLIVLFIIGNAISAIAETYLILFVSRIVTAFVTGVLITFSLTVASEKIPLEKMGGVISIIFSGITISAVLGVPIGTYIGQISGWRMTFWTIALLGVCIFIIYLVALPKGLKGNKSSIKVLVGFLVHPRVILAFFIPALSIAATYTIYTYLTAILEEVLSIPKYYISLVLLLYGVVSVFSNLIGGKIASNNGISKLGVIFLFQAIILTSLYFSSHNWIAGLISICLMSLAMYLQASTIQLFFVHLADRYFPSAKELAASLTPISLNIGIAIGSALGGWTTTEIGLIHVTWVGGVIAVLASLLAGLNYRFNRL